MQLTNYNALRSAIARQISAGTGRLREAYQRELVRTHWNIGRIMNTSIDMGAPYTGEAARIMARLSRDFKRPTAFFYNLSKFHRFYPTLPDNHLTWSHYLILITFEDKNERGRIEQKAIRENLNVTAFRALDRRLTDERQALELEYQNKAEKIPVARGKLYCYRVAGTPLRSPDKEHVYVDMGFGIEREVRLFEGSSVGGGVIEAVKRGESYRARLTHGHPRNLYTYKAIVKRVIDGDSIAARVDLGFRTWVTQRLRLRSVSAPEATCTAGRKAAYFVKKALDKCPCVVIRTHREEKFGRYLIDLFYKAGESDAAKVLKEGTFLNQELIDKGLARKYNEKNIPVVVL